MFAEPFETENGCLDIGINVASFSAECSPCCLRQDGCSGTGINVASLCAGCSQSHLRQRTVVLVQVTLLYSLQNVCRAV